MFRQMPQPETPQLKGFAKVKAELLQEIKRLEKELDLSQHVVRQLSSIIEGKNEYIDLLEQRTKQSENA